MFNLLARFEKNRNFTEDEAWKIFKLVAFAEAFGWTCLISSILLSHYNLVNKNVAIPIAGQIHGTIFIAYFLVLFFTYPSLNWKRSTFILGLIAGIAPYGSIIFEIIVNHYRQKTTIKNKAYLLIQRNSKIIVVQPSHGLEWQLPNIEVKTGQSSKKAAEELLKTMFGFNTNITESQRIIKDNSVQTYYKVSDPKDFFKINLFNISKKVPFIDEVEAVNVADIHLPFA